MAPSSACRVRTHPGKHPNRNGYQSAADQQPSQRDLRVSICDPQPRKEISSRSSRKQTVLDQVFWACRLGHADFIISYWDANGERQEVNSGTTDRDAAQQIANKLEAEVALRKRGVIDVAQERLAAEARRPLSDHLEDYRAYLKAKDRTPQHVAETCRYVQNLTIEAGLLGIRDIESTSALQRVADRRDRGASLRTCNAYLRAIKSFSRWLWKERRLPEDPLCGLSLFNEETDRRHVRRELNPEELKYLLRFVESRTLPDAIKAGILAMVKTVSPPTATEEPDGSA